MSRLLKVNLENAEEDLTKVGELLFGENKDIEVVDEVEYVESEINEVEKIFNICVMDNEECVCLGGIEIEQVHKQYDFNTEKMYSFYKVVSTYGNCDDTWEKFEELAETFNKVK